MGFIRAEVISWQTLLDAGLPVRGLTASVLAQAGTQTGSYASAREHGLLRTEGKEYVVQDGDVVEFKI